MREELQGNAAATTKVHQNPSDLGILYRALAVIIYTPCLIQSTCLSYNRHSVDTLLSSSQWACCEFVSNAVNNDKVVHQYIFFFFFNTNILEAAKILCAVPVQSSLL